MRPVNIVSGVAVPLDKNHVDTDQIIPARYLKRIERTGYGEYAFAAWRSDPDFVLNQPAYRGAKIMVTGENFGCGSSREHAVWALTGLGIEALVGISFADIFANNALQSGLLTIELPAADIADLMDLAGNSPGAEVRVDLTRQTVSAGEWARSFDIDPDRKNRLLRGLDDISLTLEHQHEITAFEAGSSG